MNKIVKYLLVLAICLGISAPATPCNDENPNKWNTNAISSLTSGLIDSPMLSYDGNTIYFAHTPLQFLDFALGTSNYPVGQTLPNHVASGTGRPTQDIYYIKWNGTSWGTPVNLGTNINTAANEVAPWVSRDELTLIFYRHDDVTRQNMISTRASKDDPWGVPTVLGGDYGDDNQIGTQTRADMAVYEPTGEAFLWEYRSAGVSAKLGRLGRGTQTTGYAWNAPVYYDSAEYDLTNIDETQPWISKDGLTMFFNRRESGSATELWKVTRSNTSVNFTNAPTQVAVTGLFAWGEVSADQNEQAFLAVALDFGNPGASSHLIRMTGTPASLTLGVPVVLNPFTPE